MRGRSAGCRAMDGCKRRGRLQNRPGWCGSGASIVEHGGKGGAGGSGAASGRLGCAGAGMPQSSPCGARPQPWPCRPPARHDATCQSPRAAPAPARFLSLGAVSAARLDRRLVGARPRAARSRSRARRAVHPAGAHLGPESHGHRVEGAEFCGGRLQVLGCGGGSWECPARRELGGLCVAAAPGSRAAPARRVPALRSQAHRGALCSAALTVPRMRGSRATVRDQRHRRAWLSRKPHRLRAPLVRHRSAGGIAARSAASQRCSDGPQQALTRRSDAEQVQAAAQVQGRQLAQVQAPRCQPGCPGSAVR